MKKIARIKVFILMNFFTFEALATSISDLVLFGTPECNPPVMWYSLYILCGLCYILSE